MAATAATATAAAAASTALPIAVVVQGTCSWSDSSIVRCGRFYPASIRSSSSAAEKLAHYCRRFGCVEVDTSTYAIPSPATTRKWAAAVAAAPGFRFHVKAFGAFCQSCPVRFVTVAVVAPAGLGLPVPSMDTDATHTPCPLPPPPPLWLQVSSLPAEARALLPPSLQQQQQHVRLASLPPAVEDCCWRLFHAALEPLYQVGWVGEWWGSSRAARSCWLLPLLRSRPPCKHPADRLCRRRRCLQAGVLGAVIFQLQLSFTPSADNLQHLLRCRQRLDPRFAMAAELRCRAWFTGGLGWGVGWMVG